MSSLASVQSVVTSETVVDKIASREDTEPTELMPLYDAIDPDALDTLVESANRNGSAFEIEFTYHGYEVIVTDQGIVKIQEDTPSK